MANFEFSLMLVGVPYCVGFAALCFWWRWWLLIPASIMAVVFAGIQFTTVPETHGGPTEAVGAVIKFCMAIGAGCGFLSSATVVTGRAMGRRLLHPALALLLFFAAGAVCLVPLL